MTSRHDGVLDAAAGLHDLIDGYWRSQVLCAAARLGVADLLASGPMTLDALAAECEAPCGNLGRLMRALADLGLCVLDEQGCYRSTALGRALESGAPGGAHARALVTAELFYPMWAELTDCVCRGGSAVELRAGREHVDVPSARDDLSALFDRTMDGQSEGEARRVAGVYDLPPGSVLVDVGGGVDALLVELLRAHPDCRGVLHDLPGVADRTRAVLDGAGVSARAEVVEGDFFADVPAGGDVYLLSYLLHDWDDEHAVRLLRTVRRAMHPGARLIVVEQLLPEPGRGGAPASLHDLHMLVVTGGRERTESEYVALLTAAGLRHTGTVATGGRRSVVEARPVP